MSVSRAKKFHSAKFFLGQFCHLLLWSSEDQIRIWINFLEFLIIGFLWLLWVAILFLKIITLLLDFNQFDLEVLLLNLLLNLFVCRFLCLYVSFAEKLINLLSRFDKTWCHDMVQDYLLFHSVNKFHFSNFSLENRILNGWWQDLGEMDSPFCNINSYTLPNNNKLLHSPKVTSLR